MAKKKPKKTDEPQVRIQVFVSASIAEGIEELMDEEGELYMSAYCRRVLVDHVRRLKRSRAAKKGARTRKRKGKK